VDVLRGGRGPYLVAALALFALTLAAVWLVYGTHLAAGVLAVVLGGMAVAQVALQAVYFMHLNASRRLFAAVFAVGLLFAVAIAWSVGYLVHRTYG
jgi:caa(3)-type oxidase subunit IV